MRAARAILVALVLVLGLGMIATRVIPARGADAARWRDFGAIPASAEGRVKPLDTVARSALMVMGGRQSTEQGGAPLSGVEWLARIVASPKTTSDARVFRIDHPGLRQELGLPTNERRRFAYGELEPKLMLLADQAQRAKRVAPRDRDPYQRQAFELYDRVSLLAGLARLETPYALPPMEPGGEWRPLAGAGTTRAPAVESWREIIVALREQDMDRFDRAVDAHLTLVAQLHPGEARRARLEVAFNRLEPFYVAAALYLLAVLLSCARLAARGLGGAGAAGVLAAGTTAAILLALALHTLGIVARIYLQGRPPVTNLYSSAVFIGWAAVIIGLFVERGFPLGLGSLAAGAMGFATQVIAHNLTGAGDTMQMMQAVLDTNFWLATHVVVVTIGYSATFFAGLLAIAYILLGVSTRLMSGSVGQAIPRATYGVVCFATLASFLGTVLGGIWADQSWGRFWGWDPKENGAALIVLMNLIILHARWAGMIRERGIAVLAVAGNIVTSWSWFGTNMLGVGLHAYGFMDSAAFWLIVFVLSQLAIMGVGLLPPRLWRSRRTLDPAKPETVVVPSSSL